MREPMGSSVEMANFIVEISGYVADLICVVKS